jgi:hypothetical protein
LGRRGVAVVVIAGAFVVCGAAALSVRGADPAAGVAPGDKAEAAPPTTPGKSSESRHFEMRTYHAAPGKLDALHARFRDHTVALFKRHGIESVAYWTPVGADGDKDTLVFVLAYPSEAERDAMWNKFAQDPDWAKAKAASEKDGPLVEKVDQVFMTPTDYSPLK